MNYINNYNLFLKNIIQWIKKHIEPITIIGLGIIFYFIFFHGIGTYFFMDVDETRYVTMARDMFNSKDFLTLYLNGEYFFEKPPLYFWQECLSFALWGKIDEWSARFPVALLGFIFSFVVYFTSRKRVNRRFGVFTSVILATSLEFIMLAKYAILDIVLTFYIGLALIVYFQTFFCNENHKKFYWWAFYLFSGLAVMAKGIPGFIVPFGVVFFTSIYTKSFKQIFKPLYIIPGILIFMLIVLPWHIIMLNKYNPEFFNEYIIKHHLHRFLNTENNEIGRKQPFYYYFIVILWGFIPWIFSTLAVFWEKFKSVFESISKQDIVSKTREYFDFSKMDNVHKSLTLCWIAIIFIFLFFSSSSTKLITYILPIYYPLAIVAGHFWEDYVSKKAHENYINATVKIFGWFCTICAIIAIFTNFYLPSQLNNDIGEIKWFCVIVLFVFGLGTLLSVKYKKYLLVFIFYVLLMTSVSGFATEKFFEIDYKFGQKDLVEFATYAKNKDYTIASFGMKRKYSLIFYNDEIADFNTNTNISLKNVEEDLAKKNNVVIIPNKQMKYIKDKLQYKVIKKGRKYTMIKRGG